MKVRDLQVGAVLLYIHTGQVVVESRHNGPCCSCNKSILASKDVHEEVRQMQSFAKSPCNQQSAKSQTGTPSELTKFQTSQNVIEAVVVNNHHAQSKPDA